MDKSMTVSKVLSLWVRMSVTVFFLNVFLVNAKIANTVEFVGSASCLECHEIEFKAWKGSDHDMAMKHADEQSVLGDFNNSVFVFDGKENRFFRKGKEYWVNIEGSDNAFRDYKISYTFGYKPLQQYMVEFDDGRIQLIPFAWDTRLESAGGQRWYHLYPKMKSNDEFYWTNTGQNWNFMCADCHSTNLKKNYDSSLNTYNTTWSEINVGCEACHGAASQHIDLVKDDNHASIINLGFERNLSKSVKNWVIEEGHSTLKPDKVFPTDQMNVCAQCHSRRLQVSDQDNYLKGTLLDKYRVSLITPELYHDDGQIYDEDYVYGSFMQSKMADKGVSCSNCHNPHSTKLLLPEEVLCNQCHLPSSYMPNNHTFHSENSEASKCTTCHMPETMYMQVDLRRDHSWKIPRPDLSKQIGTPNVCGSCHDDKDDEWADNMLKQWFPNSVYRNQPHFAIAFYAADINHRSAVEALSYIAQDTNQSDIIRGSALQRLGTSKAHEAVVALRQGVKHESELVRIGTIQGSAALSFSERWRILETLLDDVSLSVRAEAAGALVTYWREMNPLEKERLARPLLDYIQIQELNSDRGFARTNLGNVYRSQRKFEQAIDAYLRAIDIEPYFPNSYVNLADLYRGQGREKLAFDTLLNGIEAQPDSATLAYSAGLSLLRQGKKEPATDYLKLATTIDNNTAQYWYVYGLSMEAFNVSAANNALKRAFEISRNPQQLFARCNLLVTNSKTRILQQEANKCINELSQYATPEVTNTLLKQLNEK